MSRTLIATPRRNIITAAEMTARMAATAVDAEAAVVVVDADAADAGTAAVVVVTAADAEVVEGEAGIKFRVVD
jgi:hypothetical protein